MRPKDVLAHEWSDSLSLYLTVPVTALGNSSNYTTTLQSAQSPPPLPFNALTLLQNSRRRLQLRQHKRLQDVLRMYKHRPGDRLLR
jgi:hypothetical protein